jgi:hypothetical protein
VLLAQSIAEPTENLRATLQANGQSILLQWWGKSGRTYFVQTSPTLNLGEDWSYEGHVLTGTGAFLSVSLPAQPSPSFIRLRYTDQPVTGDPYEADPDQDGLSNREEIQTHGTNPLDTDSDDDGMPDGWEVQHDLNPLSAVDSHGAQGDPDGDTLTNLMEYQLGSSPWLIDTDGDLLPDWWEFRNQTSLISNLGQDGPTGDIDQDGYTNLQEYRVLSDPRNASSYPGSGGPRQEFGGGGNTTPNPSFAAFLARRVRQMSFGSSHRFFRPIIYDWDIYHEREVPNASPPPPPDDQFNGDADVNGNTQDPGDPRDIPDPWEPTIWERCDPDSPGAIMRKELTMFSEMDLSCDTPAEEERYSHYVITNAYPGEGGRVEVEDSSLEFSRSKALAAMESLPMYQGSPENGWMGAGRWGTFVSTVTSQWHYQIDEEEELCCYGQDGQIWNSYPFYMSYVTMSQEEVRNQCNQPAPAALTQAFVLVKREIDLSGPGSGAGNTETVTVLGSLELRIEEGQMISSQASANFPLPEGVSVQGGTILLTSPPVAPGKRASYDLLPIEVNVNDTTDARDDMVRKEQKIGSTAWRQWIPCTVKIPESGPGKTITSIGVTAESGTMKFVQDSSTPPTHTTEGAANVAVTLDAQGQGKFWITGITQSTTKGDAKLQIRKNGATGGVLATQSMTVFWFDSTIKAEAKGNANDTAIALSADKKTYGIVLGNGMDITATASVVPAGLDHTVKQIADWQLGIMQNVTTTRTWRGKNTVNGVETKAKGVYQTTDRLDTLQPAPEIIMQISEIGGAQKFEATRPATSDTVDPPFMPADDQIQTHNGAWLKWHESDMQDTFTIWSGLIEVTNGNRGTVFIPIKQNDWKAHGNSSQQNQKATPSTGDGAQPTKVPSTQRPTAVDHIGDPNNTAWSVENN